MSNLVIELENVSMTFKLTTDKIDNVKEFFIRKLKGKVEYNEFAALKDISLCIYKGERIGVIGHNGAGKSTMLKLISRVMRPTSGKVNVTGNIAPLLELGAGFDYDMTGSDNIFLNGAILGKEKAYLEKHYNEIVEYAELGNFINVAIKNYSSGMKARLGFSIATVLDPDILIIDEVLGVGDEHFKQKSAQTMKNMILSGKTIILVSHNLKQIENFCDRVIWLDQGTILLDGPTKYVCRKYKEYMSNQNNI